MSSQPSTTNNHVVTVVAVSPAVKALAGSLGGIVEALTLQPIDVVKTRLQLDKTGKYKGKILNLQSAPD